MDGVGVLLWIGLAVGVGFFWRSKSRSFASGLIWSLILSPLVGFIIGLILQSKSRTCPHCAEPIRSEAKVCRYCSREIGIAA